MNGDYTERLPQAGECRNESKRSLLDAASETARRVLEEIKALAGTTACKSVQLVRLRQWAEENGCWFDSHDAFGDFFDRGSENEVYLNVSKPTINTLTLAHTTYWALPKTETERHALFWYSRISTMPSLPHHKIFTTSFCG